MANDKAKAAKQKPAPATPLNKIVFFGKLVLFLLSFGFLFANLLED